MEEVRTYIESGILELYVIGDLSFDERLIVEMMAAKYPEIKDELAEIERAFEGYAEMYAVEPDGHLRDKILKNMSARREVFPAEKSSPSILSMPSTLATSEVSVLYKYAFAASIAFLLVSWYAMFVLYNRLEDSRQQIASLQASNQKFAVQVNYMDKALAYNKQSLGVLSDPDFKIVKLKGTKNAPASSILVAFNPKMKDVMIDMSGMKMPANDQEHQYQLWALVGGDPVDLGVFDMDPEKGGMLKMRAIGYAEGFAVTLERRGGSIRPTMDQMMVMGAI